MFPKNHNDGGRQQLKHGDYTVFRRREFTRLVGTSVYRYIIQKRLMLARQLMSEGVSPTAAYHRCGFADYSGFYRAFKSEYHLSPKEYAAELNREGSRIFREAEQIAGDCRMPGQEKV